jgi:hypothetical protein
MKEIDLKAQLEKEKIGQENVLMSQENKRREARILAAKQMLESTQYTDVYKEHERLYTEQLIQEEDLRHHEKARDTERTTMELAAKTNAHKRAQKGLAQREQATAQEISEQVERTAAAEYNYQVLQDKYNQHEEQRRILTKTRISAQESQLRLEQLQNQLKHLERDNEVHQEELRKEMITKAKTDLMVEHQMKVLQLQKQKREKDNEMHVTDAMLDYIQSEENTTRIAQSEAIALQNEVIERDNRAKKELQTTIERHQRLSIGQAVAKYSQEYNIEMGTLMNNIEEHISGIDVPEVIKPFVVEHAIAHQKAEHTDRRATIEAIHQKCKATFGEKCFNTLMKGLRMKKFANDQDELVAPESLEEFQYNQLIGHYQHFWSTRRSDELTLD